MKISAKKYQRLENLSNPNQVISALAIDQRDSMVKLFAKVAEEDRTQVIKDYKSAVSKTLTQYASSILLDPIYGMEAAQVRDKNAGLLLSYEVSGYVDQYRLLRLMDGCSALRLVEAGADAAKLLLYYDVDDTEENKDKKKAVVERIGAECRAMDLPCFLEIITYDQAIQDTKSKEYAKIKPRKVLEAMREFSKPRYGIDVLKMEVPVDMHFVEGYGDEVLFTKEEAMQIFRDQSKAADIPYIFLSAGVPMPLFMDSLRLAKEAGAEFHGVLCGRATWKGGVDEFIASKEKGQAWLESQGKENILALNQVIEASCTPWTTRLEK